MGRQGFYSYGADEEQVFELLMFAAGKRDELPELAALAPDRAADYLQQHKVTGRALARLRSGVGRDGGGLRSVLDERQKNIERRFRESESALINFIDAFCDGMDVVQLKGQVCFYYTGDPLQIRGVNDIDLSVGQPTVLLQRLKTAGLEGYSTNSRAPAHAFHEVTFEGFEFDLHKYVAVWRRPIRNASWRIRESANVVEDVTFEARITTADIAKSGRVVDLDGRRVIVPSPALAALILVIASHRDFIMHCAPHLQERPPVRLADLLEAIELLNAPDFEEDELIEAVRFFELSDQLDWFGNVAADTLGETRFLDYRRRALGEAVGTGTVPRIVGSAFWLPFRYDARRDLLRRVNSSDLFQLNRPVTIALADGERREVRIDDPQAPEHRSAWTLGGATLDGHAVTAARQGRRIEFSFDVGAEITDLCSIYFECDGEMLQWENVGSFDAMNVFAVTCEAREAVRSFKYAGGHVDLAYEVPDARTVTCMALGAGIPQLPWTIYSGWLVLLRVEFT